MRILTFFFMNAPQNGHRRYLSCIQIINITKGVCSYGTNQKRSVAADQDVLPDVFQPVRQCAEREGDARMAGYILWRKDTGVSESDVCSMTEPSEDDSFFA